MKARIESEIKKANALASEINNGETQVEQMKQELQRMHGGIRMLQQLQKEEQAVLTDKKEKPTKK